MRFFRTVAGKSLLFIMTVICAVTAILSVIGIAGLWGMGFYEKSQETMIEEQVISQARSDTTSLVDCWLAYDRPYAVYEITNHGESNLHIVLKDAHGKAVMVSDTKAEQILQSGGETPWTSEAALVWEDTDGITRVDTGTATQMEQTKKAHGEGVKAEEFTYDVYFDGTLPVTDALSLELRATRVMYSLRFAIYGILLAALVVGIVCFIALMSVAARRPGTEELFAGPLNWLPTDVLFILAGLLIIPAFMIMASASHLDDWFAVIVMAFVGLAAINVFLGLCMGTASRIKRKRFFRHTVIFYAVRGLFRLIRRIPMIWRTVLITGAVLITELIVLLAAGKSNVLGLWFLRNLIAVPVIFCVAIALKRLLRDGRRLAQGDISTPVSTNGYIGDFRKHAQDLNRITEGMNRAVEERMRSERMKTELITNVSHDLKTPLTSIVNYATLIADPDTQPEQAKEYAQVLVRQSDRMKRLIEDLVEASKASTGTLDVQLVPCDANVFLEQAQGEYEERFTQAGLELVVTQHQEPAMIRADSRRMWRIFDNLMSNACKYSQPGTRVYMTLQKWNGEAVILMSNTSKEKLNISPEELMERFVRGDESRNTEGNGLGLSIAKSLAELQGGRMELVIDGDLFKAVLRFPLIG